MYRVLLFLMASLALAGTGLAESDLLQRSRAAFQPLPDSPPALAGNPASAAKLELGRMLYFDPRLSASQLISCNTCHNIGLAGGDLQETSTGHNWQKGPRNAPTVLNAVFNIAQFWDGRAKDLAEQAKGPVQASVEMNNTPERVIATLQSLPEYREMFSQAFPSEKQPLTFDNVAKAIEVFEATLLTPAPFDNYLRGDTKALSAAQLAGLQLFLDKGCASCHGGVNIGGAGYFPFGVIEKPGNEVLPPGDMGRYKVTKTLSDEYVFRAPSLRNVGLTPPYFHSGKIWGLKEAVGVMGSAQLGIQLSAGDEDSLVAFLGTLDGQQPLVEYPLLPPNRSDTPRPILR